MRIRMDVVRLVAVRATQGALLAVACSGAVLMSGGCASRPGKGGVAPAVESLYVLSVPVAVNFDNTPEPDGFAMTLFAKGPKSAKGVTLPDGVLEVWMYDGVYSEKVSATAQPLRVWRFKGVELKRHSGRSAVGAGYRFTLRWEEARPTQRHISLVARFVPDAGVPVVSAPSSVAVNPK
jgi:hypothetical protein